MRPLALVIVSVSLASGVSAQVVAKSEAVPEKSFRSPMVLTVAVPEVRQALEMGEGSTTALKLSDLAGYTCDDVVVQRVIGKVGVRNKKKGDAFVELHILLTVKPGQDKLVHIQAELKSEGKTIGSVSANRLDAEERKRTATQITIPFLVARLEGQEPPTLSLTFFVRDN